MKWGIRRYQNEDGSYTQKGIERYRKSKEEYRKAKEYASKHRSDRQSVNARIRLDRASREVLNSALDIPNARAADIGRHKAEEAGGQFRRTARTMASSYVTYKGGEIAAKGLLQAGLLMIEKNPKMGLSIVEASKYVDAGRKAAAAILAATAVHDVGQMKTYNLRR